MKSFLTASMLLLLCLAPSPAQQASKPAPPKTPPPAATPAPDSWRLERVLVPVRDLKAAQEVYRNTLGFTLSRPQPYETSDGTSHNTVRFANGTLLEILGMTNREKLLRARPWIVGFLAAQQGSQSVGLEVSSSRQAAAFLRSRHVDATGALFYLTPTPPRQKPPWWSLVTPKLPSLPEGVIFYVEYSRNPPAKRSTGFPTAHPNTAQGVLAAWIVTRKLDAASKDAQALGFRLGRSAESKILGARMREFDAGHKKIVLLEAQGSEGPVPQFSRGRGEGLMGISLEVENLEKARALIQKNTKRSFPPYPGFYGNSFLIPGELAGGVWIEMVQKQPGR